MGGCELCPRRCGALRARGEIGYCGSPALPHVARAALHFFEEPPVSGTRGSGAIFFTGCSLGCAFCQNREIRSPQRGREVDAAALGDLFLALQEKGAHNVNLVTPTHYADTVIEALERTRARLTVPVIYNCGGYERVETLRRLSGLVDIYLPDFKFLSPEWARACAAAPDYGEVATAALAEMVRQTGAVAVDSDGILQRGVMVRHLVLPGARRDSVAILDRIADTVGVRDVRLSLMWQYTPEFLCAGAPAALSRRVTSFEYQFVARHAEALGFDGFFQGKDAATAAFTPDFHEIVLP